MARPGGHFTLRSAIHGRHGLHRRNRPRSDGRKTARRRAETRHRVFGARAGRRRQRLDRLERHQDGHDLQPRNQRRHVQPAGRDLHLQRSLGRTQGSRRTAHSQRRFLPRHPGHAGDRQRAADERHDRHAPGALRLPRRRARNHVGAPRLLEKGAVRTRRGRGCRHDGRQLPRQIPHFALCQLRAAAREGHGQRNPRLRHPPACGQRRRDAETPRDDGQGARHGGAAQGPRDESSGHHHGRYEQLPHDDDRRCGGHPTDPHEQRVPRHLRHDRKPDQRRLQHPLFAGERRRRRVPDRRQERHEAYRLHLRISL